MFFVVSKILGYLLSPVLWVLVLLLIGLVSRNATRKKRTLIASLILLYFFSNSFIVGQLVNIWSIDGKSNLEIDDCYDVGIVLGGTTISYEASIDRKIYHGNIDRLLQAVQLYKEGRIQKIMITGASGNLIYRDVKESLLLKEFLDLIEIPDRDVIVETEAENTYENARYCKQLLNDKYEDPSVLLFTSSMHMRRSLACFRKQGIRADSFSTNLISQSTRWNLEYLLLPDAVNLKIWEALTHEMMGYMVYKSAGYL